MITASRLKELIEYCPNTGLMIWKKDNSNPNRIKAGSFVGTVTKKGYVNVQIDKKMYKAHRLAWLYVYGEMPSKQIDHINGVRSDNRISNLREANNLQNSHNRRKPNNVSTTGFLGVVKKKDRFQSRINVNGKRFHLGCFDTAEEAYAAYVSAKRIYHEFCTI